ncbi:type IV secretory system conjugative DNA transfer family protein [Burkholderia gladioli pv. gladioli]|uniref:Type IV secretion system protein VirD4 n=1 Tax=Burkholderia gladioli TaxID=28095 RepID=A0A095F1U0_BURGA|nr:type IV secretory system conjugative DNA transfer family protein [Burkholderia gladioli]AJW97354.1 type IV secretory system Conjugative DNA transfer family protein [Burkholderia gladioli]ASD80026.1 type IV secretion system protein VirD4 [Burkholderia gladioli pv. gladioli]AWY54727.1 type IV secretion system protein VirD4 [Burkholderia gladioli pv. gladioli]KGC10955.1 type IV secretory system Conjugative DNA transfer family protein [Burkholderia gladioli]MDJ1160306.1 type IV secretory system
MSTVTTSEAFSGPPLVVGVWRGRYLRFTGQQFVLLAAPARSGKGVGIVVPNLLSYPDSVVVLDIKQENFNLTAGFRRAHGHDVYLFNPFAEDGRTHRYNPLSAISDGVFRVGDILAIGYALYPVGGHDDFWKDQARNLFLGIVLLLCEWRDARRSGDTDVPDHPVTMGEVLRQSSGNGMPVKAYLQQALLQNRRLLTGACVDALNRFLANDDKVLASILATFNAPLTIWANPIVDAATSASDFDLRDVRRRRMSVYVGITPDHLTEAALLVNLVFSQLVNLNTRQLPQDNPELKVQCLMLMDEFTSVGKIHIIARAVAYMAGYNLRLLSIVQSVSQLESVYGRADARTFVTNHAMQIIYAPREQKDANEYSEMLGTFTDRSRSVSRSTAVFGGRGGSSESFSEQRRPLLLPQELKELGREKEIILLENTKPILAGRICYWREPVFTSRLRTAPAIPAMDLVRFIAQVERRVRDVQPDEVDEAGVMHIPPEYLEVLQAWDPRDLPRHLNDMSDGEAAAYAERHFMLLGVPAARVAVAARRLSPSDLDVAELRPSDGTSRRKSARAAGASPTQRGRAASRAGDSSNVVPLHGERR